MQLLEDPPYVEQVLLDGARKAREHSSALMAKVREAVGISPIR
jgi:tryptophanyl-tRNA synthetase